MPSFGLCPQALGIQRYVFTSIFNCDKHPEVPLMNIKACTEKFLAASGVPYTTLRFCGFHQVWITLHMIRLWLDRALCCVQWPSLHGSCSTVSTRIAHAVLSRVSRLVTFWLFLFRCAEALRLHVWGACMP